MAAPDTRSAVTPGNFDALRIFAVVLVVYGNGLVLTGAPGSGLWGAPFPRVGLDLLFAISGYLAVGSWERAGDTVQYLARRALRLLPGLVACVLATVFLIGPLATRLPLRAYLLDGITRRYLANIVLVQQLWLPGVFEGQQWVGTVNPMLWTLVPGILCWAALATLGLARPRARLWWIGTGAILCAAAALFYPVLGRILPPALFRVSLAELLTEIPFFLVGAWLALLQSRMGERIWRADLAMLFFAANWVTATWLGAHDLALEWATLPYMAVCFGRLHMPVLRRPTVLGNPSFGFYLFAFPIQQLIVARFPGTAHPILACLALSFLAGLLSWHLVERPALHVGEILLHKSRRLSVRAAS